MTHTNIKQNGEILAGHKRFVYPAEILPEHNGYGVVAITPFEQTVRHQLNHRNTYTIFVFCAGEENWLKIAECKGITLARSMAKRLYEIFKDVTPTIRWKRDTLNVLTKQTDLRDIIKTGNKSLDQK